MSFKSSLHKFLWYFNTRFYYKESFYEKMSLKNPKTLRKC